MMLRTRWALSLAAAVVVLAFLFPADAAAGSDPWSGPAFSRNPEQYGRHDAALSAYQRVDKDGDPSPISTYTLAQRGIQRINHAGKH